VVAAAVRGIAAVQHALFLCAVLCTHTAISVHAHSLSGPGLSTIPHIYPSALQDASGRPDEGCPAAAIVKALGPAHSRSCIRTSENSILLGTWVNRPRLHLASCS